jgi:hypothetical protein
VALAAPYGAVPVQLLEEREDIATLQLPTDNHPAVSVNAMDLKNGFRNVETDCRDRLHV